MHQHSVKVVVMKSFSTLPQNHKFLGAFFIFLHICLETFCFFFVTLTKNPRKRASSNVVMRMIPIIYSVEQNTCMKTCVCDVTSFFPSLQKPFFICVRSSFFAHFDYGSVHTYVRVLTSIIF